MHADLLAPPALLPNYRPSERPSEGRADDRIAHDEHSSERRPRRPLLCHEQSERVADPGTDECSSRAGVNATGPPPAQPAKQLSGRPEEPS